MITRIRTKKAASTTGGGGGGSGAPTFIIPETEAKSDALVLNPMLLQDAESKSDIFALSPMVLNEVENRSDIFLLPNITITPPETATQSDIAIFVVGPLTAAAHVGDTDEWGDAWTDNTALQTGTNHGNETPLAMAVGVLGVGVNLAWVAVNLTRFTGLTGSGNVHTITGAFTNSTRLLPTPLDATITLRGGPSALGAGASRGFTESTLTQANQPATPTGFVISQTLPGTANNAILTFTLTDAQLNTILGKWATLRFESSAGTVATPDALASREATAANRMTITFTVTI